MRFLRLTLGPGLISPSPAVTRGEVLNIQYVSDGTVLELYSVEGDLETILDQMESSENTFQYEHSGTQSGKHYLYHHGRPSEGVSALVELLEEFHLVVVLPLLFDSKSGATVDIIGEFESLQQAFEQFPADIRRQTTIEQVGDYVPTRPGVLSVLTERQQEVLNAAVEVGHYAIPRTGTAEDVADAVGCAPSTASEHLQARSKTLYSPRWIRYSVA